MSMRNHYHSNLRDTFFNLFEFLSIGEKYLGKAPFNQLDTETAIDILKNYEDFCRKVIAPTNVDSDQIPLKLDAQGNVTLPPAVREAFLNYHTNEWYRLDLPENLGGFGAPSALSWAAYEFIAGSNPCITFYSFNTLMARTIHLLGTEEQKKRFALPIVEKPWGGTMVLTEPDAGSDVGMGRTKAKHIKDDQWELEGVKRFITNGDFDGVENVVHLVLARPEGAGVGTKGLSMFIVPKYLVNDDGSLGERNGIVATNIEKKMGIKGSATCEMTLGANKKCIGYLVGNKHDGIAQMFHVIEHARMSIGMKSMSTLSSAYKLALDYAKTRVQGPDLKLAADKTSPRVNIIEHPDVRRMLLLQKSYAEGMRAFGLWVANLRDEVDLELAKNGGKMTEAARNFGELQDLCLPLIKGFFSEKVYELLATSLQCFGGSGFCQDYPIEQYIRDQKIDSLYEGTTHIQALDLIFRKILRDKGAVLKSFLSMIATGMTKLKSEANFSHSTQQLELAFSEWQKILGLLQQKMTESVYHVGLHGNRFLFSLAQLAIGHFLGQHALIAQKKLSDTGIKEEDRNFYQGKIASFHFYCQEILPEVSLHRKVIELGNLDTMEVKEELF